MGWSVGGVLPSDRRHSSRVLGPRFLKERRGGHRARSQAKIKHLMA